MTRAGQTRSTSSPLIGELDFDPADTSITATTLDQAHEAAARLLPAYWFKSQLRADLKDGQHYDNLTYVQTAGIPVGNYSIHREPSRQFSLFCSDNAPDENGNPVERDLGLFETMEEAVQAIRGDLQKALNKLRAQTNRWTAAMAA